MEAHGTGEKSVREGKDLKPPRKRRYEWCEAREKVMRGRRIVEQREQVSAGGIRAMRDLPVTAAKSV